MNITVESKVFETYPGTHLGVIVLENVVNSQPSPFATLLSECSAKMYEPLKDVDIATHSAVVPWREAYAKFGAKPNKFRSSIEALLRRVQKNAPIPSISPLVDLYNALSIKYCLPCGAEDLDAIQGDLRLAFASGVETGMCLGESEPSNCEVGEVAYLDAAGFVCRRWNWREADRTKITAQTSRAIFVSEALSPTLKPTLDSLMEEFVQLASAALGGTYRKSVLKASNPRFAF